MAGFVFLIPFHKKNTIFTRKTFYKNNQGT